MTLSLVLVYDELRWEHQRLRVSIRWLASRLAEGRAQQMDLNAEIIRRYLEGR